ncbi:MAG TPA: GAF domain-containing protein [Candidatus Eremiobacteraceae bacterium]|nr:GAF domain-containing protein [Candidatus Eremiobacteraceae bacterium]
MPDESQRTPSGRSVARTVVVIALATFVLGSTLPNLLVTDTVGLPFSTDVNNHVNAVYSSGVPVRVGDVIDWAACGIAQKIALNGEYFFEPGASISIPIIRDGRHMVVSVVAPPNPGGLALTVVKRTSATLFVIIAALLLLRRPSKMFWGFYLYALGSVNGSSLWYEWEPIRVFAVHELLLSSVFATCAPIGLMMFASRFPQDRPTGWRVFVDKAIVPSTVILVFTSVVPNVVSTFTSAYWVVSPIPVIIALTLGFLCIVDAFVHLRMGDRQRLKWVTAGLGIFYLAYGYEAISSLFPGGGWPTSWSNAGWTIDVLSATQIIIPITVAYAVLKHRVLDVNFVMSRALVYGVITTIVIGVFALVDWFFSRFLAQQQIAAVAEIVAALGMGFGINAMHRLIDRFIDRLLFRRRHLAEVRLARATAGIHHVTQASAIDETLTDEPVDALGLTSAAVFHRARDGSFERARAIGWDGDSTNVVAANDSLVQNLQGERGLIRLRDVRRPGAHLPDGQSSPAIAVPLFVRHDLDGFVLFGSHVGGEDFDPVEIALLERLANAAASTYDHLEAQAAMAEADRLARELSEARSVIASLRTQPAL